MVVNTHFFFLILSYTYNVFKDFVHSHVYIFAFLGSDEYVNSRNVGAPQQFLYEDLPHEAGTAGYKNIETVVEFLYLGLLFEFNVLIFGRFHG